MNGMSIAQSLGGISDELLAEALCEPKITRKRKILSFSVAAMIVAAVSLGLYFGGITPFFRTGYQHCFFSSRKEVYKIVRLENTAPAQSLYVYSVTPSEEIIAAVKEEYKLDFETAIYVFATDKSEYRIAERYWFPLIRNGEIRLVIDVRVTKDGIRLSYTHQFNDFLNTVSRHTDTSSPGYIVLDNDTFFCVVDGKAYCTECIWDELEYIGDVVLPKNKVSVVRVN